jgi:ABC-type uncharacterized transport system permease subunit
VDKVKLFLIVEAAAFCGAALVHAGLLAYGYEHRAAMVAETVIAAVLVLGLFVSAVAPRSSRAVGLIVQGFALLGTLVGAVMIGIGVGPQSGFDIALHAGFIALLVTGLTVVARTREGMSLNRA